MKKILLLVLIISSMLFSAIRNQIPLPASQLSTDNNGSKSAIEAYRDGVGIYTVKAQNGEDLDNKEMNSLVFKYGEAAGKSNTDLKEYVLEHGDSSEKESASKLGKFEPFVPLAGSSCDDNNVKTINDRYVNGICVGVDVDGKNCNDNNVQTINDIYVNGICLGINVEGQDCSDSNIETINDKYTDGICVGLNVEGINCDDNNIQTINDKYTSGVCSGLDVEGLACDDKDIQTINDKYIDGICIGVNVEGQICNDNNIETIYDMYINGICKGENVQGRSCDDNNAKTINDKYVSGVCVGTNVEGQTCNDSNVQTIDDKYTNGICVGTNVEGQTCNDNNAKTINDKYVNGVCVGTNVEGQTCNDNNAKTINDKYVNGVCVGTNVEGQTCNDNNAKTINDKYTNGICTGTNVEGQTCSDGNPQTINDKYVNGACVGTQVYSSCLATLNAGKSTGDGIYFIDIDGTGPTAGFNVYCDMTTSGGGWTLVSWNKGNSGTANLKNDFFISNVNPSSIANFNSSSNFASSINAEGFSAKLNTRSAMLKSSAYSAAPIVDLNFGNWNYNTPKCTGNLNHTGRSAGCAGQGANDNFDSFDRFNIAIGQNGIVPYYLNAGNELCYSGKGWCDFQFFLR